MPFLFLAVFKLPSGQQSFAMKLFGKVFFFLGCEILLIKERKIQKDRGRQLSKNLNKTL
jgi:hypothetical protein